MRRNLFLPHFNFIFHLRPKRASREEMARTAQAMTGPAPTAASIDKAGLVDNLRDPKPNPVSPFEKSYQIDSSQNHGPPPSYSESNSKSNSSGGARPGWDTSYTTATLQTPAYNPSGSVVSGSVNPVPSTPYNPFQWEGSEKYVNCDRIDLTLLWFQCILLVSWMYQ